MKDYRKIPTSAEVWAVIHARHRGALKVFSSYSAPDGDPHGDPDQGRMCTAYGFEQGTWPIIEARTTWDIERAVGTNNAFQTRHNERHEYWLCVPVSDES